MILAIWIAVELVWFNVLELFLFFEKVIHVSTKKINSNSVKGYYSKVYPPILILSFPLLDTTIHVISCFISQEIYAYISPLKN